MSDQRKFAWLRIAFGVIWSVDAFLKWQPGFIANFTSYISGNLSGQPQFIKDWINLWINVVGVNPHAFAVLEALAETAIAIALIFGIFPRLATLGGIAMSLVIWSAGEGFGNTFVTGSTDIGTAIIYVLVFLALWFGHAWTDLHWRWRWGVLNEKNDAKIKISQ